jgi:hypothetical protein
MKIGDKVHCTAYVERSRHGISIMDYTPFDDPFGGLADDVPCKEIVYFDVEKKDIASIPYNEFTDVTVDKFKTIEKEFDGIYVGTTRLATKLTAIMGEVSNGKEFVRFYSECFKRFAVVYYANNRKRLVPIECLKGGAG